MIARNLAIAAGEKKAGESLSPPAAPATSTSPRRTTTWAPSRPSTPRQRRARRRRPALRPGTVKVRHLLEVILNDVGLEAVKAAVKKPLTGLKVAPYLGCMVPRPTWTAPTPTTSSRTTSTGSFEPSALTSWTTRSRPSAAAAT